MKFPTIFLILSLSACGFKGDLYLPKEDDKAKFGVIQTGLQLESAEEMKKSQENTAAQKERNP